LPKPSISTETEKLETGVYQSLALPGAGDLLEAYSGMAIDRRKAFLDLARHI
jgi:hypothetical protein